MKHLLTAAVLATALAACNEQPTPPAASNVAATSGTVALPPEPAGPVAPTSAATPAAAVPAVAIDGEGLRLVDPTSGNARPLPFGTARADTLRFLSFLGPAKTSVNEECGEGPVAFAGYGNGLTLLFQGDRFVGWGIDAKNRGDVTTMTGIGIGATRADLDEAGTVELVPDSTIGTEFSAGGLSGLLSGTGRTAKVTDLWAGVACIFR